MEENKRENKNKLLFPLAKNDFKSKYAGSVLGTIWAFISPIITILIYWFVFQVAFGNGDIGNVPYVVWLVAGIIPWFFFSETWGGITGVLTDYSYLVKKVVFNVDILPKVRVISGLFVHLCFVVLMFIIYFVYRFPLRPILFQIIYYMAANILLVYGIGKITAVLNVFIKDTGNLVGIFVQFGFWLTPIFWNIDDIRGSIPRAVEMIFKLNPIYYIVQGYRDTFVYGVPFWEHLHLTIYFWILTALLLFAGHLLFKRAKSHFADML